MSSIQYHWVYLRARTVAYTSSRTRLIISFVVCFGTFQASFASAAFAPGSAAASSHFNVSSEVGTLGTSLFVLGFAFGPVLWAPASELIGRRWPLIIGMFGGTIFLIASATSKDIQTLVISRFFSGFFGASQLSIVPAVLADIFDDLQRGTAIALYALTVFGGPFLAPLASGFTTQSYLGWRWTLYLPAFLGFFDLFFMLVFLKETYAAKILSTKAAKIRRKTQNFAIHAKHEEVEFDIKNLLQKYFLRPLRMLFTEPVILFVTIYMSMIYGLVYAFVESVPYVFETVYGANRGVAALPFLALTFGQIIACIFIVIQYSRDKKKLAANNRVAVPEWRLSPTPIGAPVFAIGLFW